MGASESELIEGGAGKVQLTTAQALKLAETIWWGRELYSREGLTHLFPGLRKELCVKRGVKRVPSIG